MSIRTAIVTVTTTGSAGSATGSADSEVIQGHIENVVLDFHASTPATADVTIAYKTRGGNILVTSNSATDVTLHPRAKCVDNANAAITDSYDRFAINDKVNVSVAQGDALTGAVVAYITYSTD